ncbi:MAG: hypothetical protein C5B53_05540 [Candidatus Melainabacteria bacterium]|nr:MAG: hypothetical protein C5B53_05540 [Candidatus Melainabacteria bacterium]
MLTIARERLSETNLVAFTAAFFDTAEIEYKPGTSFEAKNARDKYISFSQFGIVSEPEFSKKLFYRIRQAVCSLHERYFSFLPKWAKSKLAITVIYKTANMRTLLCPVLARTSQMVVVSKR